MAAKNNTKAYLLRLPKETYEELERRALFEKQNGSKDLSTVNKIINRAIRDFITRNGAG